jgi:hypothetical protein
LYSTVPVLGVKVPVAAVKNAPPNFRSPAPVNVIAGLPVEPASAVTSPVTVTVPVEIVISCLVVPPLLVKAMLPAFKVPAPTASVLTLGLFALGMVTAPETLRVIPELMLTVVLLPFPDGKVRDAMALVGDTFTVTVWPLEMTTASEFPAVLPGYAVPEAGQPAPAIVQVPFVPQLPVPADVNVQAAAYAGVAGRAASAIIMIMSAAMVFIVRDLVFIFPLMEK